MATAPTYSGMSGCEAMNRSNRRAICGRLCTSWANHVMYQLSAKYGRMPAFTMYCASSASAWCASNQGCQVLWDW